MISGLESNLIQDGAAQAERLKDIMDFNVIQASKIHNETHPEIWRDLQTHLERYESLMTPPPLMEGICVTVDGIKYKFTGAFPSMNRICGAVRYPLGIDYESEKDKTFAMFGR